MGLNTANFWIVLFVSLSYSTVFVVSVNKEYALTSFEEDVRSHRSKRWIWGGCGLIPSCDVCSDGLICKQCSGVFLPVEYARGRTRMIRCARNCPEGYNVTSTNEHPRICVRVQLGCKVRNCDDCHPHNPVSCKNCSTDFYSLQRRIMGAVKCVRDCPLDYTPTVTEDGKKTCKNNQQKCKTIVPHCAQCLDNKNCQKCEINFLTFVNKTTMVCVQDCPAGLIEANSGFFGRYCKKPTAVCRAIPNCERCPDKVSCRRCSPRYMKLKLSVFSNATCVSSCPSGFIGRGRRCQRILEDGCFDEYCLTCKVGWYRVSHNKKRCITRCPAGYYSRGHKQKFCLKCVKSCESCKSRSECIKCKPGTSKMTQGSRTSCVQTCPLGYTSQDGKKTGKICLPQSIK